jgi:hypothetical protein
MFRKVLLFAAAVLFLTAVGGYSYQLGVRDGLVVRNSVLIESVKVALFGPDGEADLDCRRHLQLPDTLSVDTVCTQISHQGFRRVILKSGKPYLIPAPSPEPEFGTGQIL